jgi:hypothetical protein
VEHHCLAVGGESKHHAMQMEPFCRATVIQLFCSETVIDMSGQPY